MRMRRAALLLPVLIAALGVTFVSQDDKQPFGIKVDVQLVELPVTVRDKDGVMIAGLKQENFQILEDKVPQQISLFLHEDIPLSMGLIIDNSGSMRNKKERVHSAALTFVRESNPDDETFIIAFDDFAYLQQPFTGSIGDLVDALDDLDLRLGTALYDAIYLGIDHVKTGRLKKKAILVISDGEDTESKYNYDKLLAHVRQSNDVVVYAVGLLDQDEGSGLFGLGRSPQKKAKQALTQIAELTGGRAYFPKSLEEVETICRQLAKELRNQYTLGYNPTNKEKDGTRRLITVNVVNPPRNAGKITVNAPQQYTAPGGSTP
jgi:Ca-activated chloride channel family protein